MLILVTIIVVLFVVLVIATWISESLRKEKTGITEPNKTVEIPLDCCGAHEVCDFDEMIKNPNEVLYFEDEELDRFKQIPANAYNDIQIEEFRDVLYTLNGHDEIRKWLLSIQRRDIQLPSILQQEALLLLAEA